MDDHPARSHGVSPFAKQILSMSRMTPGRRSPSAAEWQSPGAVVSWCTPRTRAGDGGRRDARCSWYPHDSRPPVREGCSDGGPTARLESGQRRGRQRLRQDGTCARVRRRQLLVWWRGGRGRPPVAGVGRAREGTRLCWSCVPARRSCGPASPGAARAPARPSSDRTGSSCSGAGRTPSSAEQPRGSSW